MDERNPKARSRRNGRLAKLTEEWENDKLPKDQPTEVELMAFEGGATRTAKAERRELIPRSAIDAVGRRLALGATKHGVNNWRKGGPEFRLATINHLLDHIFLYLESGGRENTDAIVCNAAFLCEYEENDPYHGWQDTAKKQGVVRLRRSGRIQRRSRA